MKLLLLCIAFVGLCAASTDNTAELEVSCFPKVDIKLGQASATAFKAGTNGVSLVLGSTKACDDTANAGGSCDSSPQGNKETWSLTDPTACNAEVSYAADKTTFKWMISRKFTVHADSKIRRRKCGCIVVECDYTTNVDVGLAANEELLIKEKKITMVGKKETGVYILEMKFQKDVNYNSNQDNFDIELGKDVFVLIKVTGTFQSYKIEASDCFASDSDKNTAKDNSYKLLKNGCLDKETWEQTKADKGITRNSALQDPEIKFSFKSFAWAAKAAAKKIFLHCTVKVCASDASDCVKALTKECPAKRMKRALTVNTDDKVRPEEHNLSLGPLYVHKENVIRVSNGSTILPCQINNAGCSEICVNSFGKGHICACRPGRILSDDGYSCMDKSVLIKLAEQPRHYDVSTEATSHEAVMIVSAVAIITILNIIAVIVIVSRKGKKYPV